VAAVLIPATAAATSFSCTAALGTPAFTAGPLKTLGTVPVGAELSLQAGHAYLIEVQERDNDALVEILGAESKVIAQADHPERRTGTRRLIVTAPELHALTVRITGKEHANAAGTAIVQAFDLAALSSRPDCLVIERTLVVADADYAKATSTDSRARDAFLHLADEYSTAERALTSPADRPLRGQTALALAEIEYLYLEDWTKTLEWARTASENLGADPYRRARADSLEAGALIQIGSSADPKAIRGEGLSSAMLLSRARTEAQRLNRFHLQRDEWYDAALQFTNIGLTYYYEGRYAQCALAATSAGDLFDKIGEIQRRAQSLQNRALCLWGLGHLPEALQSFENARADIGPQPYPSFYLTVVNNTALADYALGHFDEALGLFGKALSFAEEVQWQRFEAQSLHGIGVTYYAIGDRARAREFLEKALAIRRKENVDGRGLMATLRALATIDADEEHLEQAMEADQEALNLAVDPSAIAAIMVQLAVHTAAAGDPAAAKAQLDKVIAKGPGADPLIQAQAQLERAVLLREMGRSREALADLAAARPQLHRGNLAAAFRADLELARTLRVVGEPRAAFAAVDKALAQSDAIRLQSANPELRSQLQIPLRAAYDLKIELLRARFELASAAGREAEASTLASAAFATADAARAHSFADVASQRYAPAIRIALAPAFRRREELYRELAGRRFALDLILDGSGSRDPRARRLMGDIAELERQVDSVNTLIAARASTAQRTSPTQRPGVPQLPAGTTLISYWLGSENAYAWVVSPAGIHWERLPPPAAIADSAAEFHVSLTGFASVSLDDRLQRAEALYRLIIRPIEPWLSSTGQWIVIPDGALAYVPFAALRDADDKAEPFVAMRHYVALAPAAWMLNTSGRGEETDKGRLLLVADPVYQADDPRLATAKKPPAGADAPRGGKAADSPESLNNYRRLPFTAQEAARIAAQFSPADVDQLIGVNATRERLLALDWSKYRFIHIATHGTVDAQVPQLSALILGSYDAQGNRVDGAVRVADLSLQTLNADVAVFSACDTALGKEVPGEGLVGIGSTVLARGARAVVASLWPVSDEIGARLMTEFYGHLLHDSMSAPAALGESMRSAIKSPGSADPALWAAFQVSVVALGPGLPSGNAGAQTVAGTNGPKEMP
jgi:CHAT domain-containing protein/tetratricopeptide (TPR) repeat protein